jgi:hypothetical protein
MSHEINVEISDNAYLALIQRSAVLKKQPEQFAAEVLTDSLSDPLLQMAGSIAADEENTGNAHDAAFGGQAWRDPESS